MCWRRIDTTYIDALKKQHYQVIFPTGKLTIRSDGRSRNCFLLLYISVILTLKIMFLWRVFQRCLRSIWDGRIRSVLIFALFTSIAMTISILTVCLTTPKQPSMFSYP